MAAARRDKIMTPFRLSKNKRQDIAERKVFRTEIDNPTFKVMQFIMLTGDFYKTIRLQ